MAVSRTIKPTYEYVGHSGDIKPTTGVGAGTVFTELDTGAKYIWQNGAWEQDLTLIYALSQALKQQ